MTEQLRDQIKDTIESEDVVLFMKGTPERVLCGNSSRALEALRTAGASVVTVDVLPDPAIREELSALSQWPTIPQVFVKGELVGGADIVEQLAETGELRTILDERLGDGWNAGEREERVARVGAATPFRLA
jgi:monothiol glutaredoxin